MVAFREETFGPVAAVIRVVNEDEAARGEVKLKRLRDGQEVTVPQAEAAATIKALLGS